MGAGLSALYKNYTSRAWSDAKLFTVGTSLVSMGSFTVFNLACYFFHKYKLFQKYKIQGEKHPEGKLLRECTISASAGQLVTPAFNYLFWAYWLKNYVTVRAPLPSALEVCLAVPTFMLATDTLFYWAHRMLHLPQFYGAVHKQHHKFKTPVGVACVYAHPFENLINSIATFVGPMAWLWMTKRKSHMWTVWVWLVIRWAETIDAHSGYKFPFSPFGILRCAEHHDFHHSHNQGCFGSFFALWDKLCGTDRWYNAWVAKNEAKAKAAAEGPGETKQKAL